MVHKVKCIVEGCSGLVWYWSEEKYETRTKMCMTHSKRGKPFQHPYSRLKLAAKKIDRPVMSFEEFLEFIKVKNCHYCDCSIPWRAHREGGKDAQQYFLDRKDNSLGYNVDNCVVCCPACNMFRGDKFTYEEFCLFKEVLKKIMSDREKEGVSSRSFKEIHSRTTSLNKEPAKHDKKIKDK